MKSVEEKERLGGASPELFSGSLYNDDLNTLSNHSEYLGAKSGDTEAAISLISKTLKQETVEECFKLLKKCSDVILVPVLAKEVAGNNKIPLVTAKFLSEYLELPFVDNIVQKEKIGRTGKGADYRLAFNPTFEGFVDNSKEYFIVDDTLTMGGTIASLHGYLKNRGAKVVGAMVMTAHVGSLELPIKQSMYNDIINKHSEEIKQFWKKEFGYGIEKLTQAEAGHLRAAKTFDQLRTRIIEARYAGVSQLVEGNEISKKTFEQKKSEPEQDIER